MQNFNEFLLSRKNLNRNFKLNTLFILFYSCTQSYFLYKLIFPYINSSFSIHTTIAMISLTLCLNIFILKFRAKLAISKNNLSLLTYILEAILEARNRSQYDNLNALLDSKYSIYVILQMSKFPSKSFDYSRLQKWVKLPQAIEYFQKNHIDESNLNDHESMVKYLKTVYPEFLTAYSNQ